MGFIAALHDYKFCPPSDNLWTVEIKEHSYLSSRNVTAGKDIVSLYNNILSVNKSWEQSMHHQWQVGFKNSLQKKNTNPEANNFLSQFQGVNGVFLAQNVVMQPFEMQFDQTTGTDLLQHGGFINLGRTFQSKAAPNTCNISFLISNWSISDILIEPWIAAVAQRGLIEYEDEILPADKSIRADITICQYSASTPKPSTEEGMVLRKSIVLYNAFPQKRGAIELKYDSGTAGQYVQDIITFNFDEYSITYEDTTSK